MVSVVMCADSTGAYSEF